MPIKAKRPCSVPGCPALVSSGRCAKHQQARPKDTRPSFRKRGYLKGQEPTERWEIQRARILARDPVCKICHLRPSRMADHVISLRRGGSRLDRNLQGACLSCGNRKTATQDGGFGNRVRR